MFDLTQNTISLVLLLTLRIGTALRFAPFFGGEPMPLLAWAPLSVILAVAIAPFSGAAPTEEILSMVWVAAAAKELFIGVFLGIMVKLAFSVLELAVSFVETFYLPIFETSGETENTPLRNLYMLLACSVFLLVNGHHALITCLSCNIESIPPGGSISDIGSFIHPDAAIKLFASAMGLAVAISIPVFAAGLCADIILSLISRIAHSSSFNMGSHFVKSAAAQLAAVAILGVTVSAAIDFLQTSIGLLTLKPN